MHTTFPKDNFGHRFFWVEIRRRTKFCLCSTTIRPQGRFSLQVEILCSSSNLNQKKYMVKIIFRKSFVHYKMPYTCLLWVSLRTSWFESNQHEFRSHFRSKSWLGGQIHLLRFSNPSLKVHPVQLISSLQQSFLRSCQIVLGMRKIDSP